MSNSLEKLVRKVARTLHDYQIARLYKIPNDIKVIEGKILYGERTPPDFMGFTAHARVMMVECKSWNQPSLPIDKKGLKPHQYVALKEVHDAGGLGLLVWQNGGMIAVIDAGMIEHYRGDRKSLPWKVIPPRYKRKVAAMTDEHVRFFWPFLGAPIEQSEVFGSRAQMPADPQPLE